MVPVVSATEHSHTHDIVKASGGAYDTSDGAVEDVEGENGALVDSNVKVVSDANAASTTSGHHARGQPLSPCTGNGARGQQSPCAGSGARGQQASLPAVGGVASEAHARAMVLTAGEAHAQTMMLAAMRPSVSGGCVLRPGAPSGRQPRW
ncbi:hypothetical protein Dimus_033965 [Dionaea muscipula]